MKAVVVVMLCSLNWISWFLFALLIAVASIGVTAEGPKKKIRIHLPQKVKHIHHHKKIYITTHPAPSQYAPAYLPGVKGALALPSSAARPAVASLVPLNQVELFEEPRHRLPGTGVAPATSKLLPLYRARGHYGPNPSEWDDQEYDLLPPPEPTEVYSPNSYTYEGGAHSHSSPPKRVKIVKVNNVPRKKVVRKVKPKRLYARPRPQPQPQLQPHMLPVEDEHPVSSFHEQFYSDLDDSGTIRKIKKPPRVEKIIDGDTEHIHTYSEEHIHKVVFDDDPKVTGVVGVDHLGSMSALTATHPLIPIKNAQTLVAFPSHKIADFAVVGSMGSPPQMEYSSYNPRDVTHDHIYHDHGEIPPGVDITKEMLRLPPKVSYNSHGVRIINSDTSKRRPGKTPSRYGKPTSPTSDFSYYESIFAHNPKPKPKKVHKPTYPTYYEGLPEPNINDFRPIPAFRFKDKRKTKQRNNVQNYGAHQVVPNLPLQQASVPAPFSVASTVVHDYNNNNNKNNNKHYASGPSSSIYSKYRDPINDFKDSYSNDFDYDTYASSSNIYASENKNDAGQEQNVQKSVSSQNINFGGNDHQTFMDHLESAASNSELSVSDDVPTALGQNDYNQVTDSITPTPFAIKETSPAHSYYTAMALKALQDNNGNSDYDSPTEPSDGEASVATTTSHPTPYYRIQSTETITQEPEFTSGTRTKKRREKHTSHRVDHKQRYNSVLKDLLSTVQESYDKERAQGTRHERSHTQTTDSSNVRGNPKYGDKI